MVTILLLFAADGVETKEDMAMASAGTGDRWNDVLNCVDVEEKHRVA